MTRYFVLFAMLVLAGCSPEPQTTTSSNESAEEQTESQLITRSALFGNPVKFQGRISPDGKYLSWLAPVDGVMNLWVAPSDKPETAKPVTNDRGQGIPIHYWTYSSDYILYTQDRDGDENTRVYRVDVETGEVVSITPEADGARATVEGLSSTKPDTVVIGLNNRNPQLFDLYEVKISTSEERLLKENPGYVAWTLDNDLTPRFGYQPIPGGGYQVMTLGDEPEVLLEIPSEDALTSGIIGFSKDNKTAYYTSSMGRDTVGLFSLDASSGETTLLASDERADINNVLVDPVSQEIIGYSANYTREQWYGLTDAYQAEFDAMREAIPGDHNILASTADGQQLVIYADDSQAPGIYYLYNRKAKAASVLFETRPELNDAALAKMQPLELKSRDGLTLVSYLTLPADVELNGKGLPASPLPMVLNVHGGPWARDAYGYNSTHQWLANRGYAVLSVNYRGSTGFGKAFVNAAVRELSGKMHDDLIDAVNWAVAEGVAQKDKVAIMGGSYGGYATLVGLTFTPDTFACGVDIVGPSNLVTLIESFPAYWGPALESTWYKYVGNPANEAERADMFNRSPISRVDAIKKPLLIGQGANDPRVTKLESDQIVAAMDEKNLPVTYLNYPDEGHGFARPENGMSFFATSEAFLSECLNGRFEEIGDDFAGSSVEVLHGLEYVPGLSEAMGGLQEGAQ